LLETKNKSIIKTFFKIGLTLTALYVVFSKVHLSHVIQTVSQANPFYLLLAFAFFNLSKIVSSIRLNIYFKFIDVHLDNLYALKLYYVGMFYNLFLPSGIGGDGYKIYLLHKIHSHVKLKTLVSVTFQDRISGLIPLLFFVGILYFFSDFYNRIFWLDMLIILSTLILLPLFYLYSFLFFKKYMPVFYQTLSLGFLVQFLQIVSVFFVIYALNQTEHYITLLTIFLISSVVAVLPISIGGVGIREITFLYGLHFLNLNETSGVAIAVIFFLITALSSFAGIFMKV